MKVLPLFLRYSGLEEGYFEMPGSNYGCLHPHRRVREGGINPGSKKWENEYTYIITRINSLSGYEFLSRMGWVGKTLGTSTAMSSPTSMKEKCQVSSLRDSLSAIGDMRWRGEDSIGIQNWLEELRDGLSSRRVIDEFSPSELHWKVESILGEESIEMSRFSTDSTRSDSASKESIPGGIEWMLSSTSSLIRSTLVEAISSVKSSSMSKRGLEKVNHDSLKYHHMEAKSHSSSKILNSIGFWDKVYGSSVDFKTGSDWQWYCPSSSSPYHQSPVLWAEIGESSLFGPELVQETTDKVVLIKEKPKAARERQKSYVDNRRKPLEFEEGDQVLLKVSPWKGVVRFGKKGKLALRYVGPFEILERIGPVAYRLRLPKELSGVHDTFHVSNLKKCLADASLHVPLDEIKVDKTLRFVEEPVEIMDREVKSLKRSRILLVKVHWNSKRGPEFTWEREDHMKSKYPQLFVDRAVESATLCEDFGNCFSTRTKSYPVRIVKDVEVHIGKLKLLNDFYVIDTKKDPETPLLVGRGFLVTANAVINCRMAKIAVGEGITRESYKPRPSSDGVGAQIPYYARRDFLDCHLPEEWKIARDAKINPFKDVLVFRRMVEFLGAIPINLKSNMWESEDLIKNPINWDKPPKKQRWSMACQD
ncbi:hypothetical protein Tco_0444499 [Tanacetum coccineum]